MNYFPRLVVSFYLPLHRLSERRPLVRVKKWENRRVRPQRLVFAHLKMYEKTDTTFVSVQYICGYNHQLISFTMREEKDLHCLVCLEMIPQIFIFKQSHLWNFFTEDVRQDFGLHTHAANPQNSWATSKKNIHKNIYRWEKNIFVPTIKQIKNVWNINHYYPALKAFIFSFLIKSVITGGSPWAPHQANGYTHRVSAAAFILKSLFLW